MFNAYASYTRLNSAFKREDKTDFDKVEKANDYEVS
jgi:hypothetical protein